MVGIQLVAHENEQDGLTYQHKPLKFGIIRGHLGYKWVDFEILDWGEDIRVLDIETSTQSRLGGVIG